MAPTVGDPWCSCQQQQQQQQQNQDAAPQQQPSFSRGGSSGAGHAAAPAPSKGVSSTDKRAQGNFRDILGDDVYSYTVKCIIDKARGWKMLKALLAVMFTFLLQIGLLILLWQGLVKGSDTGLSRAMPETDKLWRQVGQVQRQVCWLNHHAVINTSVPAGAELNCSGAWFDGGTCIPLEHRLAQEDPWNLHPESRPVNYSTLKTCLQKMSALPQWLMADDTPARKELLFTCNGVFDLDGADLAFGVGLLYPDFEQADDMLLFGRDNKPQAINWTWDLSNAAWLLADVKVNKTKPVTLSLQPGCMPELPASSRVRDPSLVNLLAFIALAVYVHEEIVRAVWLAHASAAFAGILPDFYAANYSRPQALHADTLIEHVFWKAVLLIIPILQLLAGLFVLVSSMALTFVLETQSSIVAIILGNVALTFVLDLDNRVGAILAAQERDKEVVGEPPPTAHAPHAVCTSANPTSCACVLVYAWGYVYVAWLGLLLTLELAFLSPFLPQRLYKSIRVGALESIRDTRLLYWKLRLLSEAVLMQTSLTMSVASQLELAIVRPCAMAFFVLLMFGNTLPATQARRWGPVMLALQTLFTLLMESSTGSVGFSPSEAVPLYAGVLAAGILWVGMFLLWPLLHRAAPRDCCGGCSCCCRSCGGCPVFPSACPGQCCCSCRTVTGSAGSVNSV